MADRGWEGAVPGCRDVAERAATAAADGHPGLEGGEISILLTGDTEMRDLNRRFRKIDKPTNVLAFENGTPASLPGEGRLLGDVVVALETTVREAAAAGLDIKDHFTHLVVHGVVHLLGYDHMSDAEARIMEARETAVLGSLGVADPYGEE